MNRWKKEEIKKHNKDREGKSADEIKALDGLGRQRERICALARKIHSETFPEEYDFMLDDIADLNRRRQGENPMNQEYTKKVNLRRVDLGFKPLTDNGMPSNEQTYEWCLQEAQLRLHYD